MSKPFSNFFKSICEGLLFPFCQFHKVIVLNQLALSGRKATQKHCALGPEARRLLEVAVERLGLSARAYTRILKIARTISDLEGASDLALPHVAEAIQYRTLDRQFSNPRGVRFARETAERYLV